jgi:hypothetical protein
MLTKRQRVARAHVGKEAAKAVRQSLDPDTVPAVEEARRNYKAVSAEAYIERLISEAPLLPQERLDRLAALLHGGEPRE